MICYPKHTHSRCGKDMALCGGDNDVTTNTCLLRFRLLNRFLVCYFCAWRLYPCCCMFKLFNHKSYYHFIPSFWIYISLLHQAAMLKLTCVIHSEHQVEFSLHGKASPDQLERSAPHFNNRTEEQSKRKWKLDVICFKSLPIGFDILIKWMEANGCLKSGKNMYKPEHWTAWFSKWPA